MSDWILPLLALYLISGVVTVSYLCTNPPKDEKTLLFDLVVYVSEVLMNTRSCTSRWVQISLTLLLLSIWPFLLITYFLPSREN